LTESKKEDMKSAWEARIRNRDLICKTGVPELM